MTKPCLKKRESSKSLSSSSTKKIVKDEFEKLLKAGELIELINSPIYSEFEQAQEVVVAAHVAGSIDLWEMLSELDGIVRVT